MSRPFERYGALDQQPVAARDEGFAGVNSRLDPGQLAPGICAAATNARFRQGVVKSRPGVAKMIWGNREGEAIAVLQLIAGGTVNGIFAFVTTVAPHGFQTGDQVQIIGAVEEGYNGYHEIAVTGSVYFQFELEALPTTPATGTITARSMIDCVVPYGTVYGVGVFRDPDDVEWVLIAADGEVVRARPDNRPSSLPLPTGVQVLGNVWFVQAFNKVFLFRGRDLAPLVLSDLDDGFEDMVPQFADDLTLAAEIEFSYGPYQAVASLTSSGTVATLTTAVPHGFVTGADVTIRGAVQTEYNGRYNITVIDDESFSYRFAGSATTPATGTITVTNNAYYWIGDTGETVKSVVSITRASGTATATVPAHGYTVGDTVVIVGAVQTAYNGVVTITATPTADTFEYAVANTPATPATGTITCLKVVRQYELLPNGNNALYVQNRLLETTAWDPSQGSYVANSYAQKQDFVVASDYIDNIHFAFTAAFRINQGNSDELVVLAKVNEGTVMAFKSGSVALIQNIYADLTDATLETIIQNYGITGEYAFSQVGADMFFLAERRGVVSIAQTVQNKYQGVDVPLSEAIQPQIDRINWTYASGAVMAYWDNKLYVAVPLDDAEYIANNIVRRGVYAATLYPVAVNAGAIYYVELGEHEESVVNGTELITEDGYYTAESNTLQAVGAVLETTVTLRVYPVYRGVNNAVLVYDFLNQQWSGVDEGRAIGVKRWFKLPYYGEERLFFIGHDGLVSLYEAQFDGDQTYDPQEVTGFANEAVALAVDTRGYTFGEVDRRRTIKATLALATFNPEYSLALVSDGVNEVEALRENVTKDRTVYYQPWNAPVYDVTNANEDWSVPYREDYSVIAPVLVAGTIRFDALQEAMEAVLVSQQEGRYTQLRLTNAQGVCALRAVELESRDGFRRYGTEV